MASRHENRTFLQSFLFLPACCPYRTCTQVLSNVPVIASKPPRYIPSSVTNFYFEVVSLSCPCWPSICHPPVSDSQVPGLQACASRPVLSLHVSFPSFSYFLCVFPPFFPSFCHSLFLFIFFPSSSLASFLLVPPPSFLSIFLYSYPTYCISPICLPSEDLKVWWPCWEESSTQMTGGSPSQGLLSG